MGAYATVPEGTTKGVIRNTPLDHSQETILAKLITDRNPTEIGARRIGNTPTIIVAFEGDRVPRQVYHGSSILECSLYRKHFDFCTTCRVVGHRRDVCTTPNVRVCAYCGLHNLKDTPRPVSQSVSCATDLIPPGPTVAKIDTRLLTLLTSEDGPGKKQRKNGAGRNTRV